MNDRTFIDSRAGSPRRWLVVDDEPELSDLIAAVLAPLNPARVESFTSSPDALAAFSASPGRFDLVVTDRDMPGLDGMELARRLRARAPGVKIILVSANIDDISTEDLRRAGVHAVVRKPFTLAQLEAIIRNMARELGNRPRPRPRARARPRGREAEEIWLEHGISRTRTRTRFPMATATLDSSHPLESRS